jgi:cytochrome c551/c552
MAANRQIIFIQTVFAAVATFATLALVHIAQPDDAKTVGASMHLVERSFATDDDSEAQLQQQLQIQQEIQQSEQQAEQQAQLDLQEAQQAEQQGLQVEQQATLSVPGS